jgi:hypothetical protein
LKVAAVKVPLRMDLRHVCVGKTHCPTIGASIGWPLFIFARSVE